MASDGEEFGPADIKERLVLAWQGQTIYDLCGILIEEARPRCIRWLLGQFGHQRISYEDAEDCFDGAVEGLLKRDPSQVTDPYNYVFTSAKNATLDILRERKPLVKYDPEWEGQEDDTGKDDGEVTRPQSAAWLADGLLTITEATLDIEVTARTEQLRAVYRLVLPHWRPTEDVLLEFF